MSVARKTMRRSPIGAAVSRRVLRWPTRNYFAEMEPRTRESHPVDDLMARDPAVRLLRKRSRRLLSRAMAATRGDALLDFEAERNHLDSVRIEVAFNVGFETGLVSGRADGLHRTTRSAVERAFLADLRAALVKHRLRPDRIQNLLQELASAFSLGAGRPHHGEASRERRGRRS